MANGAWLTLVISMLISRITLEISGSLTSWFEIFMISVDFCIAPVTLNMAERRRQMQPGATP